MKEDCSKIIEHYGVNHQQRKLAEEVFELQEAIVEMTMKMREMEGKTPEIVEPTFETYRLHIAEELADVMVLLRQFQAHYNIDADQLGTIMYNKIQRTLKRMEKE